MLFYPYNPCGVMVKRKYYRAKFPSRIRMTNYSKGPAFVSTIGLMNIK
jgi:hypothetical protein